MLVTAVRRLVWLAITVTLFCVALVQLAAPKAQAAVAQHATLTAVTKPAFNPACVVNIGPLSSSVLCNKVVSGAISKGVATVIGGAVKQAAGSAVNSALGSIGNSFFGGIAQALNAASDFHTGAGRQVHGGGSNPQSAGRLVLQYLRQDHGPVIHAAQHHDGRRYSSCAGLVECSSSSPRSRPCSSPSWWHSVCRSVLQVMLLFSDSIATAISGGANREWFTGGVANPGDSDER